MTAAARGEENVTGHSAWVGRSETRQDVAAASAAAALDGLLEPADRSTDQGVLFPTGHWLQFAPTEALSELGADGHPRLGGFLPPLTLPRRMWAGSRIEYHAPIAFGARLRRTSTIESITPKNGSTGRLCFIVLRHDLVSEDVLALSEWQTIVYREAVEIDRSAPAPGRPPREDGAAPEGWDWGHRRRPDEIALFRYSALTFNAHRIHYDVPYATGVEGYPGLVVQGPLLATFIVDGFLREHPGASITSFEFSARAPVFVNELLHVVGRHNDDGTERLALIGPDGRPATTATIAAR